MSDLRNTSAHKGEGGKESNEGRVAGVFIKKERAGLDYAKDIPERIETLKYKSVSQRERKKEINTSRNIQQNSDCIFSSLVDMC